MLQNIWDAGILTGGVSMHREPMPTELLSLTPLTPPAHTCSGRPQLVRPCLSLSALFPEGWLYSTSPCSYCCVSNLWGKSPRKVHIQFNCWDISDPEPSSSSFCFSVLICHRERRWPGLKINCQTGIIKEECKVYFHYLLRYKQDCKVVIQSLCKVLVCSFIPGVSETVGPER